MSSLSELYQNVILEHNRSPRNYRIMEDADRRAEGSNPLCGDQLTVWLKLDGDVISDVAFQGLGCAISRASASLMTAAVKGKSRQEAEALFQRFHRLVTGRAGTGRAGNFGEARRVLGNIRIIPIRVKCASLPWHTLRAALGSRVQRGDRSVTS